MSENTFDYAMMHAKRKPQPPQQEKPKLQLQAAAAAIQQAANRGQYVQRQGQSSNNRQGHVPFLRDLTTTTCEASLRRWIAELCELPNITLAPDFVTALQTELAGGDSSLHVSLSHATGPLPPTVTATVVGTTQILVRVYFLFKQKQCGFCPPNRHNPQAATHKLCDCPTFNSLVPPEVRARFFADPFNSQRYLTPLPPTYSHSAPAAPPKDKNKRDRYDPNRKGNNRPKRARNDNHIR